MQGHGPRSPFIASNVDLLAWLVELTLVLARALRRLETLAVVKELSLRTDAARITLDRVARIRKDTVQVVAGTDAARHALDVPSSRGTFSRCTNRSKLVRYMTQSANIIGPRPSGGTVPPAPYVSAPAQT